MAKLGWIITFVVVVVVDVDDSSETAFSVADVFAEMGGLSLGGGALVSVPKCEVVTFKLVTN